MEEGVFQRRKPTSWPGLRCVALFTTAVSEMHCSGVFVEFPGLH